MPKKKYVKKSSNNDHYFLQCIAAKGATSLEGKSPEGQLHFDAFCQFVHLQSAIEGRRTQDESSLAKGPASNPPKTRSVRATPYFPFVYNFFFLFFCCFWC